MSVSIETGTALWEAAHQKIDSVLKLREYHFGGSAAINGTGNDLDVICLVDCIDDLVDIMENALPDFKLCGEESYESQGMFVAFRSGSINLIVCENAEYYRSWIKARDVCIWLGGLGLDERKHRVAVHRIIVDGEFPND